MTTESKNPFHAWVRLEQGRLGTRVVDATDEATNQPQHCGRDQQHDHQTAHRLCRWRSEVAQIEADGLFECVEVLHGSAFHRARATAP